MATLMSWGNSEGIKGRCDSRCHEACEPKCVCMCGGRFHGCALQSGGVQKAVEDFWDEAFADAIKRAEEQGMELAATPLQLSLLPET